MVNIIIKIENLVGQRCNRAKEYNDYDIFMLRHVFARTHFKCEDSE